MTLLGLSWRIEYLRPPGGRSGRPRGRPVLYSFWHGRQLPLIFTHRREGVTVLVSSHRDGEYVARVLEAMGFPTIRGSTTRGGAEAMKAMASVLRRGIDCAITPDGPRGPACEARPGMAYIARLAGRPVVPMGTSGKPSAVFGSWDSFRMPLPFCRMVVVEGVPMRPPARGEDPAQAASAYGRAMDRATATAELLASPGCRVSASTCASAVLLARPAVSAALALRPRIERLERKGFAAARSDRPVWMHGASLGEIAGLLPLAERLVRSGFPVHVTCCTPAARARLESSGLPCSFAPLDVPSWIRRFLGRLEPRALVLAETELWPNLLFECLVEQLPCAMVNARLSSASAGRYRLLPGGFFGKMLSCFSGILCRSVRDAARFETLGVPRRLLDPCGDSKALAPVAPPPGEWRAMLPEGPVLVAGSTHPGEDLPVAVAARSAGLFPVLAPRHLERLGRIRSLLEAGGFRVTAWSELESGSVPGDAVLVDRLGILASLYGCADVAFIGGTLDGTGGHNVLEPLKHGVPAVAGPFHGNIEDVIGRGLPSGACRVADETALPEAFRGLLAHPPDRSLVAALGGMEGERVMDSFERLMSRTLFTGTGTLP